MLKEKFEVLEGVLQPLGVQENLSVGIRHQEVTTPCIFNFVRATLASSIALNYHARPGYNMLHGSGSSLKLSSSSPKKLQTFSFSYDIYGKQARTNSKGTDDIHSHYIA